MRLLTESGHASDVPALAKRLTDACAPVDQTWLRKRLGLMWDQLGHSKDADIATAWLHETSRLLGDVPHDIVSDAIDEAIKAADRGFMPTVGEIRKFADPILRRRQLSAARARQLAGPKASPTPKPEGARDCTPEEATAILREFNIPSVFGSAKADRAPARIPDAEDYRAMGVEPSQGIETGTAETAGLCPQDESPVGALGADAPNTFSTPMKGEGA